MNIELQRAEREWKQEADAEAARLIREGVPPFEARMRAESIVSMRRTSQALTSMLRASEAGQ